MRRIWAGMVLAASYTACVESEAWNDEEMDARNFPKESSGEFDPEPAPLPVCGDNVVNVVNGTLEQCDGVNLLGKTCEDFLYDSGELRCSDECTLDLSECEGAVCGNGFVDSGEACDINSYGPQLRMVCEDDECGTLRCDENCQTTVRGECGDGILQAPTEQCDGDAYHPVYLFRRRPEPYDQATLRCVDCRIDFSEAGPAVCGNELLENGEECEQSPWSDRIDDATGRRVCIDCRWVDDSSFCGDGIVQSEWNEQCDGELSAEVCLSDIPFDEQNRVPCVDCWPDYEFCIEEEERDAGPPVERADAESGPDVSGTGASNDAEFIGSATEESTGSPSEESGCAATPVGARGTTGGFWCLLLFIAVGRRRRASAR